MLFIIFPLYFALHKFHYKQSTRTSLIETGIFFSAFILIHFLLGILCLGEYGIILSFLLYFFVYPKYRTFLIRQLKIKFR